VLDEGGGSVWSSRRASDCEDPPTGRLVITFALSVLDSVRKIISW
jgi:hypothetical protein